MASKANTSLAEQLSAARLMADGLKMKKLLLIFAMIFMTLVSASAQDSALWRYVNTLDGVNVRDKPSLSGKKKFALKCNERVQLIS